jgi:GrpB-like predicted nucleotidyltransferase (UPF0157 family)
MFNGPDTDINLHVFSSGCPEIDRMLMFRDWLRSNAAEGMNETTNARSEEPPAASPRRSQK